MAKRYRLLCVALFLLFLFSLAGCGASPQSGAATSGEELQQAVPGGGTGGDGAEIALFITEEQKMQGLGQAVWNAVSRFSGEQGVTYGAYVIDADDVDAALATIDLALKGSARIVVAMGDEMAGVVERAQVLHEELQFVLLGVEGSPTLHGNAVRMEYDELQAGWLAGYAAVLEGYRVLAFVETVPSPDEENENPFARPEEEQGDWEADADDVTRLRNLGFVLGADAAASSLGLEPAGIQVQTLLLEEGANATERRETIAELYESGVELLFAGDGASQSDALRIARSRDAGLVGIALSFANDDAASVASVERVFGQPLYSLLLAWNAGDFPTERVYYCGLGDEGYTLESTGFARLTTTQYATLAARFADGSYAAFMHSAVAGENGGLISPLRLSTEYVTLVASQVDEDTGTFQPPAYYSQPEEPVEEDEPAPPTPNTTPVTSDTGEDEEDAEITSGLDEEDTGDEEKDNEPASSEPDGSGAGNEPAEDSSIPPQDLENTEDPEANSQTEDSGSEDDPGEQQPESGGN